MLSDRQNALLMLSFLVLGWCAYLFVTEPIPSVFTLYQLLRTDQASPITFARVLPPMLLATCVVAYGVIMAVAERRRHAPIQKPLLSLVLAGGILLAFFFPPSSELPPRSAASSAASKETAVHKDYWPNGQLKSEEPLVNGLRHGIAHYYWDNGKPYSTFRWTNGKYDGIRLLFRADGSIEQQVSTKNGLQHGELQWFNADGTLEAIERWYEDWRSSEHNFQKPGIKTFPYGQLFGLVNAPQPVQQELAKVIQATPTSTDGCATVTSTDLQEEYRDLRGNICADVDRAKLSTLLMQAAPSLKADQLVYFKDDLDGDGEPDLLVGHVAGAVQDCTPCFAFYFLTFKEGRLQIHLKGPYANGRWLAIAPFRPVSQSKTVFVKYAKCSEGCDAPDWQLEIINFRLSESGLNFLFHTRSAAHGGLPDVITESIVYSQTDEPYTATAIETRILALSPQSPEKQSAISLIQRVEEREENFITGQMESTGLLKWNRIYCSANPQCTLFVTIGELPPKTKQLWDESTPLETADLGGKRLAESVAERPKASIMKGLRKELYPNGQVKSEEALVKGIRHGLAHYWWPNGEPYGTVRWADGKYDGVRLHFRKDGSIRRQASARKGVRHGVDQWFNPDGTLDVIQHHYNGMLTRQQHFGIPESSGIVDVYSGLPPYGQLFSLIRAPRTTQQELAEAFRHASISHEGCATVARLDKYYEYSDLRGNICGETDRATLTSFLTQAAPFLDPTRLAFYKGDLDGDGAPDLLAGYVAMSRTFPDPFFAFYFISFKQDRLVIRLKGPYLNGRWHAFAPFGPSPKGKTVFVRYQSCTSCHFGLYLEAVNFQMSETGAPFLFGAYRSDKQKQKDIRSFQSSIEYTLPGHGHSVDAEVETKIINRSHARNPSIIQKFTILKEEELKPTGEVEWWLFSCQELQCPSKLILGKLPAAYAKLWKQSQKL